MSAARLRPRAQQDIDAAADWYAAEEGLDLALRFYAAVEATLELLLEQPRIGARVTWVSSRLLGCRHWTVAQPFGVWQVYYLKRDDGIEVLRVLHGARDVPRELE